MPERRRVRVDGYVPSSVPAPAEDAVDVADDEPEPCSCPHLDADDWDRVESDWNDITFVKTKASALLGIVTGLGKLRNDLARRAQKLGATVQPDAMLLLGAGQFRRDAMLEVEGEDLPRKGFERPGGLAYTRLVSAPPGKLRGVVNDVRDDAKRRFDRFPDNVWLWYLTCRECSEERAFETLVVAHYRNNPVPQ